MAKNKESGRIRAADSVFINCPFDTRYWPMFEVLIYTIMACGFTPRSALEINDSADVRIEKIKRLIGECRYGIHDISRVEVDESSGFPRFNMPFELGLDMGCRSFGSTTQKQKRILILDKEKFRFHEFLSDLSGQDISAHEEKPDKLMLAIRNWLTTASTRTHIVGPKHIATSFANFSLALPEICDNSGVDRTGLKYPDYLRFAAEWLKQHPIH